MCRVQYVTDPNKTISDNQWLKKWPSYFTGQVSRYTEIVSSWLQFSELISNQASETQIKPTCQPLEIDVNTGTFFTFEVYLLALYLCSTAIFTYQTGLTYTVTNVWQRPENSTLGDLSPSLTYLNNPIQSCVINTIQVDLESEDRSASQYAFAMWGQNVLVG